MSGPGEHGDDPGGSVNGTVNGSAGASANGSANGSVRRDTGRSRRVLVPFGTRPEIVKLAPVVRALRAAGHTVVTVDTGQHSDPAMSGEMQRSLGLVPDVRLTPPPRDPAARQAALFGDAVRTVAGHPADLVLALGDTSTVPAYALAARAAGLPFAHLEAGLRSFNERSLEETNRRVAAAAAHLHFAPTALAARFLAAEGVPTDRVFVVGNPVIDVLRGQDVQAVPPGRRAGVLVTAHRATNVDDPARLSRLTDLIVALAQRLGPVRFPVHPRTAARLAEHGCDRRLAAVPGVALEPPLPYEELLRALAKAKVAVTDSGGIQEEAGYLGVPVVVLRRSTPRWEGVAAGSTVLSWLGDDEGRDTALRAALSLSAPRESARIAALPCPYGAGDTGRRVARVLADPATDRLLTLTEPDFAGGPPPWADDR